MFIILKSIREKDQITKDGFLYSMHRINKATVIWKCSKTSCKASARTAFDYINDRTSFLLCTIHNHESIVDSIFRKEKITQMKKIIIENKLSPREAVNKVLVGADFQTIRRIGNQTTIVRALRRYMAECINPRPYYSENLNISINLCTTHNMKNFYQYGIDNFRGLDENRNIMIFYSNELAENLINSETWCVDGTFTVVPTPYYQLYTIGFIKEHHVIPCVFAFLKDKRENTYKDLYRILDHLVGHGNPRIIKTDFEKAAINALRHAFPSACISGCLFHLGQSIYKRVLTTGLSIVYNTDRNFKKFVKLLTALAFVKPEEILSTFNEIKNNIRLPNLIQLYNYFEKNYIDPETAIYLVELWHVANFTENNIPRTNNAIEAWHGVLKRSFGGSKYSFNKLLSNLKMEEDCARRKFYQIQCSLPVERSSKHLKTEEKIRRFLENTIDRNYGLTFVNDLAELIYY